MLQWAIKWHAHYPDALVQAGSAGVVVASVSLLSLVLRRMVVANAATANPYLHGSARWANLTDIQAADLVPGVTPVPSGVVELIRRQHSGYAYVRS